MSEQGECRREAWATHCNGCPWHRASAERQRLFDCAFDSGYTAGYMAAKADAEAALKKALADA